MVRDRGRDWGRKIGRSESIFVSLTCAHNARFHIIIIINTEWRSFWNSFSLSFCEWRDWRRRRCYRTEYWKRKVGTQRTQCYSLAWVWCLESFAGNSSMGLGFLTLSPCLFSALLSVPLVFPTIPSYYFFVFCFSLSIIHRWPSLPSIYIYILYKVLNFCVWAINTSKESMKEI